jgi:hypothetical protein
VIFSAAKPEKTIEQSEIPQNVHELGTSLARQLDSGKFLTNVCFTENLASDLAGIYGEARFQY